MTDFTEQYQARAEELGELYGRPVVPLSDEERAKVVALLKKSLDAMAEEFAGSIFVVGAQPTGDGVFRPEDYVTDWNSGSPDGPGTLAEQFYPMFSQERIYKHAIDWNVLEVRP